MALVLVVDDEEPLRRMMETLLTESGYTVLHAHHGQQAMELAREAQPDLILSDLMMPVLDGLSMCQQIRSDARTAHIPVIAMSAGPQPRGLAGLVKAYVSKPFELDDLLATVAACLSAASHYRREDAVMEPPQEYIQGPT